ncbi:hypothetical protein SY83_14815 [Paenibacillus swuensis]|uniref:UPF0178 protein SY83_14815 n=1 Tax=Paenibacillus swuensis TaxID=1178515 RepID=A0A172TJW7_9BACL|nr:DUF188 domain-containing protein [Paenibacillus swuensis]ANE47328.1 hypothetical protein SY83_14815 [Paenibacillus swuensis]
MIISSNTGTGRILVDADACPVKQEIVSAGASFGAEVWMIASYDHRLKEMAGVHNVQVDRSDQSVDLYIANQLRPGDVLVTQDFGLATIGLAKRAVVLSNRGQRYTDLTMDFLLETRHEQAKKRRGGMRSRGPKPMTDEDRKHFLQTLTKVLTNMQENK